MLFTSIGLYFAVGSNFYRNRRLIPLPLSNRMIFLLVSIIFTISNLSMLLVVNVNLQMEDLFISIGWFIILNMITFFGFLKLTKINFIIPFKNIITSLFITLTTVIKFSGVLYLLVESHVQIQLLNLSIASLLTIALAFSILRFKTQLEESGKDTIAQGWGIVGIVLSGISIVGIYYLYLSSMVGIHLISDVQLDEFRLIIIITTLFINLILISLPDFLGHNRLIESEKKLQVNREHFKSLFNHNPDAVFAIDLNGRIISVNKVAIQMTFYKRKELLGMFFSRLIKRDDVKEYIRFFQNKVEGKENTLEIRLITKNSHLAFVKITSIPIYLKKEIIGFYHIVKDVTDSEEAQRTIHFLAYHDELTTLPNRRLYTKKLYQLKNQGRTFAIMNIDFDRFKRINDLFGHAFGDQVLVEIKKRLKKIMPEHGFIARMGGDEFSLIVPYEQGNEDFILLAKRIVKEFQKPLKVKTHDCLVTASIGIAIYPKHTNSLESLVKFADIAMYEAKENGANDFRFYNKDMNDKTIEKIQLENDLRRAIVNNELTIYYQPKYHAETKKVLGAEALVRWNHPKLGLVSPGEFIKLAEETGLIIQLEEWVLDSVCEQLRNWKRSMEDFGRVSINISHMHFYQGDLFERISHMTSKKGIEANWLEIEITESTMMHNEAGTQNTLNKLRELGIEVSMDDFGTGYSSLGYLHRLPIDRLKIDKSFIQEMYKNEAIVSTIISMAKHLKLKVIAEGVETNEQLNLITKLGCVEIQGFYFSKPLSSQDFENQILKKL